jgi:hypothetical protein
MILSNQRFFCERRFFRQRYILVAALILALPISEKAPMNNNSSELVRLIPNMEQHQQIGETYTNK